MMQKGYGESPDINRDKELKMESGRNRQTGQSKQSSDQAGGCIREIVIPHNPCAGRCKNPSGVDGRRRE